MYVTFLPFLKLHAQEPNVYSIFSICSFLAGYHSSWDEPWCVGSSLASWDLAFTHSMLLSGQISCLPCCITEALAWLFFFIASLLDFVAPQGVSVDQSTSESLFSGCRGNLRPELGWFFLLFSRFVALCDRKVLGIIATPLQAGIPRQQTGMKHRNHEHHWIMKVEVEVSLYNTLDVLHGAN